MIEPLHPSTASVLRDRVPQRLPYTYRDAWRVRRLDMEARRVKSHPRVNRPRRWNLLGVALRTAGLGLRLLGLSGVARRRALRVGLTRVELFFPDLPEAFEGYRLLHITDPHFDMVAGSEWAMREALPREEVDLAVFTGDYRDSVEGEFRQILEPMRTLCAGILARDGMVATLGNHDTAEMVPAFEELGLRVLLNESMQVVRGDQRITLTGLDDVHYYYTEQAPQALKDAPVGFKVALVHSSELSSVAAASGFSLYLSGHTHGGQVCLPFGIPVLTHTDQPRSFARGLWRRGQMQGFTSRGAGVVGLPLRLNCPGEIVLITLRRGVRVA